MFSILGSGTKAPKASRPAQLLSIDLEVPDVLDTATFANG